MGVGHPVYDCIHLAMCEREGARLAIADTRLAQRLAGTAWRARMDVIGEVTVWSRTRVRYRT